MGSLIQDVRYAVRQMRKSPGFAFTAIAVLALGIGANIAVFTILNGILLRPMPYRQPDGLVTVTVKQYPMSYANMLQLRDGVGRGVQMGATFDDSGQVAIVGLGGRFQAHRVTVSANLPTVLGVQPMLGRSFAENENDPGRTQVLLLSEEVWRKVFGADRKVLGQTITIKSVAYTIVGVMPKGFSFPYADDMQIWSPAEIKPAGRTAMSGDDEIFGEMYARLPEGMSVAQLGAELSRVQALVTKENPSGVLPSNVDAVGYQQSMVADVRKPLLLLYAVVFAIWALACLNVTSLMLTRSLTRIREHAVRSALGATRARLLQQSIVESVLLSGIGGGLGFLLGEGAIKMLWRQIDRNLPLTATIHAEGRVVACLIALTLLTAVIVGAFPAIRAGRRNVRDSLQGVNSTVTVSQNRTREGLVVAQLSLTLVFLVGAGLFLRTIHALRQTPVGFTEQNVLTGGIILNQQDPVSGGHIQNTNLIQTSYEPLLNRLHAIPGVQSAALSSVLPLRHEFSIGVMMQLDHQKVPPSKAPRASASLASPELVEALGISMNRGRFFTAQDTATSAPVVVVNQAFVDQYLAHQDPLIHTLHMGDGREDAMQIVGVIPNLKQYDVTSETKPEIYFCLEQATPGTVMYGVATAFIQVAVRGSVPADTLRNDFDRVLHEIAPNATMNDVKTMHEAIEDSFGSQKLIAQLLEGFAAVALMIASVGLYGLLSFAVAQRTREIGVRIALGAQQGNILSLVLQRALLLVAVGLAAGTGMAWFAARFASSYLYGVQAHDAFTFTAVILVLAASSFFAAWMPARRAAAVDPIIALRSE